ncbi:FAD-binding oxidoreductase [Futiania mangrovi]|uniref:FAD-binding oxidoreductase n=1 Tax=Futiania mangrovi TaxID=2959716 RepID=A0A9J6PP69_9PROT|nr:FAD-binding oxidoreductase [Futiania mangrovii]MCP1337890.1 FAD-binding oxidoreductase [Futiania mangrovii]
MNVTMRTLDGDTQTVSIEAVEALRSRLRGTAALPGEPGFDEARTVWNGMIDRTPGLAVRALGTSDIREAVAFARDNGLLIAIRAGGHQIAGHAVADGALLLDLSQMRSVHVDPQARTARVEPGCLLSDVDRETQLHGLAVPVGINSTTGISGLTLGGGFGWITRKFGMTIDNLISADVVTADGEILKASADENPDLFWALRGGGGNFGVVSSFEFRLHPVGPQVMSGLVVHPLEDAPDLLRHFRRICAEAPDDLTVWAVMRKAPPLPFLPAEWHGREVLIFAACYAGDMDAGELALRELRSLGTPVADVISPHPFTGWQAAFDGLLTPGARNYWKSHDFTELSDAAIETLLPAVEALPDPQCEVFIAHVGGAMARVASDETAFPQRDAHFTMNVHTRWEDPAKDAACIGWAREMFTALQPHAAGSVYVNFMPEDETDRLDGAYGGNMERLQQVKARYDPQNLFRVNHNIQPAARAAG